MADDCSSRTEMVVSESAHAEVVLPEPLGPQRVSRPVIRMPRCRIQRAGATLDAAFLKWTE